jgi:hypothetical protein
MTKASMKLPSVRASGTACAGPGSMVALLARLSAPGYASALLLVNGGD